MWGSLSRRVVAPVRVHHLPLHLPVELPDLLPALRAPIRPGDGPPLLLLARGVLHEPLHLARAALVGPVGEEQLAADVHVAPRVGVELLAALHHVALRAVRALAAPGRLRAPAVRPGAPRGAVAARVAARAGLGAAAVPGSGLRGGRERWGAAERPLLAAGLAARGAAVRERAALLGALREALALLAAALVHGGGLVVERLAALAAARGGAAAAVGRAVELLLQARGALLGGAAALLGAAAGGALLAELDLELGDHLHLSAGGGAGAELHLQVVHVLPRRLRGGLGHGGAPRELGHLALRGVQLGDQALRRDRGHVSLGGGGGGVLLGVQLGVSLVLLGQRLSSNRPLEHLTGHRRLLELTGAAPPFSRHLAEAGARAGVQRRALVREGEARHPAAPRGLEAPDELEGAGLAGRRAGRPLPLRDRAVRAARVQQPSLVVVRQHVHAVALAVSLGDGAQRGAAPRDRLLRCDRCLAHRSHAGAWRWPGAGPG
mmetsp:Transcript_10600/g.36846  ORF Transcript_10600/g.36846 Transcript_10600/m.36846 type:complete len:491 (-) Transcript_10600:100-1572(-)